MLAAAILIALSGLGDGIATPDSAQEELIYETNKIEDVPQARADDQ